MDVRTFSNGFCMNAQSMCSEDGVGIATRFHELRNLVSSVLSRVSVFGRAEACEGGPCEERCGCADGGV